MLSIHCTHFVFHISVSFINLSEYGFVDVLQAKKTKKISFVSIPSKSACVTGSLTSEAGNEIITE